MDQPRTIPMKIGRDEAECANLELLDERHREPGIIDRIGRIANLHQVPGGDAAGPEKARHIEGVGLVGGVEMLPVASRYDDLATGPPLVLANGGLGSAPGCLGRT
jgi:hypothetical protein